VLPRGHRFAIELRLWSASVDDPSWPRLLNLLGHPGLRLGGATRAGLGKLACLACRQRAFDLRQGKDAEALRKLPVELDATNDLGEYRPAMAIQTVLRGALHLSPRGFWRIGQGSDDPRGKQADKPADLLPVREQVVDHDKGKMPVLTDQLLFPASSLKGALAHRMSFHARRFAKEPLWASKENPPKDEQPKEVDALLGSVKDNAGGQAGALFIDDAFLPLENDRLKEIPHNSIDRFTGGVRNRVLYSELSIHGTAEPITIELALDLDRLTGNSADLSSVRRALQATMDDLCQGRLALGSRTTTGNGLFTGTLKGELADWLDTTDIAAPSQYKETA